MYIIVDIIGNEPLLLSSIFGLFNFPRLCKKIILLINLNVSFANLSDKIISCGRNCKNFAIVERTLGICVVDSHLGCAPFATKVAYNTGESAKRRLLVALLTHIEHVDSAFVRSNGNNLVFGIEADVTDHCLVGSSTQLVDLVAGPGIPDSNESALG